MKTLRTIIQKIHIIAGDERGFTIQELLVVMIVGAILISLSLTTYMFASKLFLSWRAKSEGRDAVERVLQQVVYDFQKSKSITVITDTSLFLKTVYEKDVAYSYGKGNVFRNGTPLLYQSGLTVAMKITRAAQDTGFVVRCLNVNVEGGFGTNVWRTSAVASILSSSRSEFTCSN